MKKLLLWLADLKSIDDYSLFHDSFSNHIRFSLEAFY
nr:hypothetical protein [Mucilaginibacter sp. X5P1]